MGDPFSAPEVAPRNQVDSLVSSGGRSSFGRSGFSGGSSGSGGIRSGSGVHGGRIGGDGGGVSSGSGGVSRFSGRLGGGLAGGDGQSEGGGSRNGQQLTDGHEVTPELESHGGNPRGSLGNAFVRSHASPDANGKAAAAIQAGHDTAAIRPRRRGRWTGSLPFRGMRAGRWSGYRPGRFQPRSGPHCRAGARPAPTG